ncbi:5622_t:CDS:2 [Funneliformis geosporum]|nr:5622_t:CDS:2 [Funneliformis geosporum]
MATRITISNSNTRIEYGETGLGYHKLLNVIGAMDGVHIPIHQPSKMGRFTYIHAGEAGYVHDARVFYRSSLYHEISLHSEQWVPGETYIIADAAYPLRTYLIKAFPNYYMGTNRERHFNKILSSMRMVIERAFGHLKERRFNREIDDNIDDNNEYEAENEGREEIEGVDWIGPGSAAIGLKGDRISCLKGGCEAIYKKTSSWSVKSCLAEY